MANPDATAPVHEPHAWSELSVNEVLSTVLHELYGPVSVLGTGVDRIAHGHFADDELLALLDQLRDATNHLSRVVVSLKRYTAEQAD